MSSALITETDSRCEAGLEYPEEWLEQTGREKAIYSTLQPGVINKACSKGKLQNFDLTTSCVLQTTFPLKTEESTI